MISVGGSVSANLFTMEQRALEYWSSRVWIIVRFPLLQHSITPSSADQESDVSSVIYWPFVISNIWKP